MIRRGTSLAAVVFALALTMSAAAGGTQTCSDFASQSAAQTFLASHPEAAGELDANGDGVACESLGAAVASGGGLSAGDLARTSPDARTIAGIGFVVIAFGALLLLAVRRWAGTHSPEPR
jgi:hypothetical protein